MSAEQTKPSVQSFGRKKTAIAVAHCQYGKGVMKLNGQPIDVMQPECLKMKAVEPVLLLGAERFANLDIRVTVKGGGRVAQVYAIRQAIARAIIAFYQKYVDEQAKREIKDILVSFDRSLVATDPRRTEPKKYGGPSARARFQKSYR